jgi:hypothetical protein
MLVGRKRVIVNCDRVRELLADGWTAAGIGRELGITSAQAWRIVSRIKHPEKYSAQEARKKRQYDLKRRELQKLKDKPCEDCGKSLPYYCMDFDHLYGKKFTISHSMGRSLDVLIAEASKCAVVCANCHRTRTWQRANGYLDNF